MELERICFHCCYFLMEVGVENLGVCMADEAFLPFEDEIYDSGNFDCCYELYLEKRYDGNQEACPQYEEVEIIGCYEEDDEDQLINEFKCRPMDDVLAALVGADSNRIHRIVNILYPYISYRNESAFRGLLDFYNGLPGAEELEDAHTRIHIIDALERWGGPETVGALVNELKRTPSNNVTRKLYTKILKTLKRFPAELITEPIEKLLAEKKFSYKIKKRIEELLEPEDDGFWLRNFKTLE